MPAREPREVLRLASEAFNAGDLDGLAALYEPEATLVPQPGQAVSGSQAIREALRGLPSRKRSMPT
ncbi:MAG: YybH family protein [Egibacteraceae bacterium]